MTFAPPQRQPGNINLTKTILFWVMMIALAGLLWQMSSKNSPSAPATPKMSYSDFMNNVDQNNVARAKLLEAASTAEVQGTLRQPANTFSVTIPKEVIPSLTNTLRKQGVAIEVVEKRDIRKWDLFTTILPFAIVFAGWIAVIAMRYRTRQAPRAGAPPTPRPIGD